MTGRLVALARITRIDRSALAAVYVCLGAYLAAGSPFAPQVLRAAVVVLLTVCFGNVVNDRADIVADTMFKPWRPLPSGVLSLRAADALAALLAVSAVAIAMTVNGPSAVTAVAAVVLSGAYSWWLKGTLLLGNLAVGILVAGALLFGGLALESFTPALSVAAMMALVFVVTQEVLFNLEDEEGDRAAGVRTTATRLGPARTITVHRALALAMVAVSLAPAALGIASRTYLYCLVPCIIAPTLVLLRMLSGTPTTATVERAGWITRFIWVSGIVPTVLLRQ